MILRTKGLATYHTVRVRLRAKHEANQRTTLKINQAEAVQCRPRCVGNRDNVCI